MLPHKDQFSGCLVGQCLGDALGFVVEGYSPEACKRYVEDYLITGQSKPHDLNHWILRYQGKRDKGAATVTVAGPSTTLPSSSFH